jgi:hypothetical protein
MLAVSRVSGCGLNSQGLFANLCLPQSPDLSSGHPVRILCIMVCYFSGRNAA